jgi:hypothetical protein
MTRLALLAFLALIGSAPFAAHADTRISALPAASALTGVEQFPCVQSGVTDKCTVTQAVTFTYSLLSGDCTATGGGAITCTKSNGSSFAALAFKAQASLTADVSGLLPIANGGNATASPAITAGTGISVSGSWPAQSVALTVPVAIANGGTNATTANAGFNNLSPMTTIGDIIYGAASGVATRLANGTSGQFLGANTGAAPSWQTPAGGSGTVTSVGWVGGLVSIATATTTPAFTIAGTSGGIPYFSGSATWASSAALTANMPVLGGGAGASPIVGTISGNTTEHATVTGSTPSGDCVQWDANGNAVDAGVTCPGITTWTDFSTSFFYPMWPQAPSAVAGTSAAANLITCSPIVIPRKMTLAALTVAISTVSAGNNFQLALYASSSGRPGALIAATASGSTTSLGFVSPALTASKQIGPGGSAGGSNLWTCVNKDNAVAAFFAISIVPSVVQEAIGSATAANLSSLTTNVAGLSCSGASCNGGSSTFNTWPATLAGSTWTDVVAKTAPVVFIQPSSIP